MNTHITRILIPAAGLLLAAGLWFRHARTATDSRPEHAPLRMAAFNEQLGAFMEVDEALILYRETGALEPAGFDRLTAVAVGAGDRIYAGGGRRLAMFTAQGEEIDQWLLEDDITCLAVDEDGRVFAGHGQAVHAYDASGALTTVFAGIAPDAIITSVAAAGGNVFVADAQSRTVRIYSPDGEPRATIDGRSDADGGHGFIIPSPYFDVAPGQGRTLWVANPGRHRIEEYTHAGVRIHAWADAPGSDLERFVGCCNPSHIARLSDGSWVTSEKGISRVKVYGRRGAFRGVVAPPRAFDSQALSLDLAVDSTDRILVVDPARIQVRIFVLQEKE